MGVAVDLNDDHARRLARKIDDEAADDDLPAELRSVEALGAQRVPELLFERRLAGAEALGVFE
jgi:hypothetical protein